MKLKGINKAVLERKMVVIDHTYDNDPNAFILRCLRCGAGWQPAFDQNTKRVLKGYWQCIRGCHDKELGLKVVPVLEIEQAFEKKRTDWFYKKYQIDIEGWPPFGRLICWRCAEQGHKEMHYDFSNIHDIIDHLNVYHKKIDKRTLK